MTAQEIFDTVLRHMREQKVMSHTSSGGCSYRGNNGTKCAVGVFIPDPCYTSDMEGRHFVELTRRPNFAFQPWAKDLKAHSDLMVELQVAHDRCMPMEPYSSMEAFENRMQRIALAHSLSYSRGVVS